MATRSLCKYCRRPIVWVRTTDGKRMPLDPMPDPGGNVVALGTAEGGARAAVLGPAMQTDPTYAGRARFMPHAATCPDKPGRHRRSERSSSDEDGAQ